MFLSSSALYDADLMAEYVANFGSQYFGDTVSNFTKECSPPSCGAHYVEEEVNDFGAPFGKAHLSHRLDPYPCLFSQLNLSIFGV